MSMMSRPDLPPAPPRGPIPLMGPESWDRAGPGQGLRRRVFLLGPYGLLALLVICTVILKHSDTRSLILPLALCAMAAAWMLGMFTLNPAWRQRPRMMAVFVAGLIVITAALVIDEPWFGFFVPAAYLYSFAFLPWPWELAGVTSVSVVAATAQTAGTDRTTAVGVIIYIAAIIINVLPLNGLAVFLHNNQAWHEWRQRSIEELSEANSRLAATLAENAGLHQQLLTQAREAGVLDERQRMAREIHDTLAQALTGIITQLQAAEQAGLGHLAGRDGGEPAEWHRHIGAAIALARESLGEARRSVHALRPEALETARLSDALADVANRWSALHGIKAQVTTTGTVRPLLSDTELVLLRTAQEALANVAKHARASRVGLTLSYMDHEVALDVRDDGQGFDAARPDGGAGSCDAVSHAGRATALGTASGGGFGLVAMRQRIEGLDGTLEIESEPGGGTAISARVPTAPAGAPA